MTEPENAEATPEATERKTGRPRSEATVAQDQSVLDALLASKAEDGSFAGLTRKQIEETTGLPGNRAYLSIWRLKGAGKVVKVDGNKWAAVPAEEPAPVG